ncbi:GL16286 [Drosophila persimilis]|uniref:GL16286 n=1 Tax=Drosophila persimilis TaxID=7234 RepID=B4HAG3_DROPE|nr:GL16286 [Drosophila persimilis]
MTNHSKFHQKNKKKYFQSNKQVLQVGQRGFFATCNINEKGCVRECYNLLNHYADILYGPEQPKETEKKQSAGDTGKGSGSTNDDDDDLDAAAAKCRETLTQRKVRFQNVETGTTNCIFIRTLLDDPVGLGKHIVDDITTTGKSMSRFVLRLVPIEAVCRANMPDIIAAAGPLFDKHFLKEPTSYGIIFNHRYNQQIKQVLRGWCLLSVIDNYLESKKYNLVELANPSEKKSNGDAETKAEEKSVEEAKPNDEDAAEESDKDRPTDETDKASAASPAVQNE